MRRALRAIVIAATFVTPAVASEVYVVDGDTIHLDGKIYRLEGIDAPEIRQTCVSEESLVYRCGLAATIALRTMLKAGPVTCAPSGTDQYGRTIAHCAAGGVEVNREMVSQGMARAFVKYSSEYLADENEARAAKRGFWDGTWEAPWDWRADQIAALQPKGNCWIKGNIAHGTKTYYLPFQFSYARVKIDEAKGERWFCTEAEAMAAGWVRSER